MIDRKSSARLVVPPALLAACGFLLLFAGMTFHFWWQLAATIFLLCLYTLIFNFTEMKREFSSFVPVRDLFLGIGTACFLYLIFYAGNLLSEMLFDFKKAQIANVYQLRADTSPWLIGSLMATIIGPGEEIFWRAYLQRHLTKRFGFWGVIIATLIYTGVHLSSGNFMLVMAALVCGGFWGLLYYRFRSLWLNIISHTLWDMAVFLFLPFSN